MQSTAPSAPARPVCFTSQRGREALRVATARVRLIHAATPALVVCAALALHAAGRPLPTVTLIALVSAAYGRSLWQEFLKDRANSAEAVTSSARNGDRPMTTASEMPEPRRRDAVLGMEPTQ